MVRYNILFLTYFLAGHSLSLLFSQQLSNDDAIRVIETDWAGSSLFFPIQGNYTVIDGQSDAKNFIISKSVYNDLVILQELGFISLALDQEYERYKRGDSFSWSNWTQQTSKNVIAKVQISPTDKGRAYLSPKYPSYLELPMGNFKISDVIQNEERNKSIDIFRLLMLKYTADWNTDYLRFMESKGIKLTQNRKAIVLLKYDPFESVWKIIARDFANLEEEFKTNHVAKFLEN